MTQEFDMEDIILSEHEYKEKYNPTGYLVLNLATNECEVGFKTVESAEKFVEKIGIPELIQDEWEQYEDGEFDMDETERTLIMPYDINNTDEPDELTIHSNPDKTRPFSSLAELYEDTLKEDFVSTQETPVRVGISTNKIP